MSYWSRSFDGLAECLSEVRQFTLMVLGDAPGADMVMLAVSELAGNAILHTASGEPGGQFILHVARFADRWQIRVDDEGSPDDPRVLVALHRDGENGPKAGSSAFGGLAADGDEEAEFDLDAFDEDDESWSAESGRGLAMVEEVSTKWGVIGDCRARAVWAEIPYPGIEEGSGTATASDDSHSGAQTAATALIELAEQAQGLDGVEDDGRDTGDEPETADPGDSAPDTDSDSDTADSAVLAEDPGTGAIPADQPADNPRADSRWPARVPSDPKVAERHRRAARGAVFMRAMIGNAHEETIGPVPLPYWPPFPHPLARQSAGRHQDDEAVAAEEP